MSTVERQHELEQNALAEWMVQLLDVVRPHLVKIVGAVVLLVAAVIAWMVISANNAATEASSWELYLAAMATGDTAAFNEVAQRYPGSDAALWSQLVLADMALTDGAVLAFEDRASSNERLESAVGLYDAVLAAGPGGLLAERATFGLAKAQESLGQLDAAQSGYAKVAASYPDSALAAVAQEHADALAGDASKDWYDWFFAQKLSAVIPPPAAAAGSPAASDGATAEDATPDAATDALFEEGPIGTPADDGAADAPAAEPAAEAETETETEDAAPAESAATDAPDAAGEPSDTP
jgi:hypothetical protein